MASCAGRRELCSCGPSRTLARYSRSDVVWFLIRNHTVSMKTLNTRPLQSNLAQAACQEIWSGTVRYHPISHSTKSSVFITDRVPKVQYDELIATSCQEHIPRPRVPTAAVTVLQPLLRRHSAASAGIAAAPKHPYAAEKSLAGLLCLKKKHCKEVPKVAAQHMQPCSSLGLPGLRLPTHTPSRGR